MMTRRGKKDKSVSFSKKKELKILAQKASASDDNSPNSNGYYLPPAGKSLSSSPSLSTLSRLERQNIVIWKKPLHTLNYAIRELVLVLYDYFCRLLNNKLLLACVCFLSLIIYCLHVVPGPHTPLFKSWEQTVAWWTYWIFLGVLSSVGLGTGLHTFLLYLGPHIAAVTLAAYECQSLRFPEPPYPNQILCPDDATLTSNLTGNAMSGNHSTVLSPGSNPSSAMDDLLDSTIGSLAASSAISLWAIMSKVRAEAFMWGFGTAVGELPPYFMAKAARTTGEEPEDEEYREFQEFMRQKEEEERLQAAGIITDRPLERRNWHDRLMLRTQKLIQNVGFFGILLFASIPNPLFDLAGITCGHFLVPFWTFFGATLLGKAVIKMHLQKLVVILSFSEHHVERCISLLKYVPKVGPLVQAPFKEWLVQQKNKLHLPDGAGAADLAKTNWLQRIFESLVIVMVIYFVVSLVNSLAQNYHRRLYQQQKKKQFMGKTL